MINDRVQVLCCVCSRWFKIFALACIMVARSYSRVVILDCSVQVQRRRQEGEWMKCSSYCVVFCTVVSRFWH